MLNRNRGFTLFELLVVVAIIGIIAILILTNYRQGQKQYEVAQAAQRLVSDIRQAQSMAVAGAETSGYGSIGGYGIRSQDNSYVLFLNPSRDANGCPTGSPSTIIKTVSLPSGVSLAPVNGQVFFAPPEPKTCIDSEGGSGSGGASITFALTKGSSQKTVTVTNYGKIEAQ